MAFKETDLYEPIKQLLIAQGFTVRGEVIRCDIAALRGEELWVVEMKLQLNIKLLYQAMERLKITRQVFIAVPRPRRANNKQFLAARRILKKLELGLITVSMDSPIPAAEIVLFPDGKAVKPTKAAERVKREINGRSADTTGGNVRAKVNTAYRERCVKIACLLEARGVLTAPELKKKYNCGADAYSIMSKNIYGWFSNTGKGRFKLTAQGFKYLDENAGSGIISYYRMKAAEENEDT